ncbi:unnamed protein product [Auanema sp. JU1783]|nr:unnamed protein product [Auanema sp. JU1783]
MAEKADPKEEPNDMDGRNKPSSNDEADEEFINCVNSIFDDITLRLNEYQDELTRKRKAELESDEAKKTKAEGETVSELQKKFEEFVNGGDEPVNYSAVQREKKAANHLSPVQPAILPVKRSHGNHKKRSNGHSKAFARAHVDYRYPLGPAFASFGRMFPSINGTVPARYVGPIPNIEITVDPSPPPACSYNNHSTCTCVTPDCFGGVPRGNAVNRSLLPPHQLFAPLMIDIPNGNDAQEDPSAKR